jgi:Secretion system C-terminal sorting domain
VDSFKTLASGTITMNEAPAIDMIGETSNQLKPVVVYPNPTSASFTVLINGNHFVAAQLQDEAGRVVWHESNVTMLEGEKLNVNTSSLPAGLYLLQLQDASGQSVVKKIIVRR